MLRYNVPIIKRFLTQLDPTTLFYHAKYEMKSGAITPVFADGLVMPNTIYVETGSHCIGRCRDCYIPVEDRKQDIHLTDANIKDIIDTARCLNVNYLTILGGEVFDKTVVDTNLRVVHNNPDMRFTACTSGIDLTDRDLMKRVKKYKNLVAVFSFDGKEKANDGIRGRGSYATLTQAISDYSEDGRRLAGALVTLRPENTLDVDKSFLDSLCSLGCYFIEIGPYYTQESSHRLSARNYADVVVRVMDVAKDLPAIMFSNHFGQLFGRRINLRNRLQSVTVDYRGNVYSARRGRIFGNINNTPLIDILYSDDFQGVFRAKHVEIDAEAVGHTDSRYTFLFDQTLNILRARGISVVK